ncbi:hypothetical protein T03_5462, partial [Trichinella britovi]
LPDDRTSGKLYLSIVSVQNPATINHAPSDIVCCCYSLSIALARSSRFDICSVSLVRDSLSR